MPVSLVETLKQLSDKELSLAILEANLFFQKEPKIGEIICKLTANRFEVISSEKIAITCNNIYREAAKRWLKEFDL